MSVSAHSSTAQDQQAEARVLWVSYMRRRSFFSSAGSILCAARSSVVGARWMLESQSPFFSRLSPCFHELCAPSFDMVRDVVGRVVQMFG